MRDVDAALAWLAGQVNDPTDDWYNQCERLQRTAYGLEAHYSSADLHAQSIPGAHRFGIEPPSRGDLGLYRNGSWGHIVTFLGNGWDCYTNDYGGRGSVCVADGRALVDWCGADSGYVADAWWSSSNFIRTHEGEDDVDDDTIERIAERSAELVWKRILKAPEETMPPLPDDYERAAGALLMKTFAAAQYGSQ